MWHRGLPDACSADFASGKTSAEYGDGDVTVPLPSLSVCRNWKELQSAPVHSLAYYGLVHAQLVDDELALGDIIDAVTA